MTDRPVGDSVKSASRVIEIIELLTNESGGATFGEICESLRIPKSSAHGLLATLTEMGFLTLGAQSRKYHIGVRLWEAGQTYVQSFDLPTLAMPFLEEVRNQLRETVQLAILDGVDNVYVAKVDSDHRLVLQSRVGARLPAYATGLGKVLLSGLSDDAIKQRFSGVVLKSFTENSIRDLDQLLEVVGKVRRNGFGTDEGEYTPGVICVATPVHGHAGDVVAAMSVSVPEVRSTAKSRQQSLSALLEQSRALSVRLGYRTSLDS